MAAQLQLKADIRQKTGKGAARSLRREGKLPAVIYGGKDKPQNLILDAHAVSLAVNRGGFLSHVIMLALDGAEVMALPRDYETHPVTDAVEHVDFIRVSADSRVNIFVPVHFENEETCPGIKRGGVLNIVRHEVEFICSPLSIPEFIVVDLGKADIGDSLHISSVNLPEGIEPVISNRDFTIATIAAPSSDEAADEEESEDDEES